jgi:hypothetical protein
MKARHKESGLKIALALLLTLSTFPAAAGQTTGGKDAPAEQLRTLIRKWNEAELKGDAASLSGLLAEEFSFVGGSNRSEYLALMKPDDSVAGLVQRSIAPQQGGEPQREARRVWKFAHPRSIDSTCFA